MTSSYNSVKSIIISHLKGLTCYQTNHSSVLLSYYLWHLKEVTIFPIKQEVNYFLVNLFVLKNGLLELVTQDQVLQFNPLSEQICIFLALFIDKHERSENL